MIKIVGIVLVGVAVLAGIGSRFLFKKTDSIVEEIAEQVIEKETGVDIDLSPDTEDPKKKYPFVDETLDFIITPKEPLKEENGEDK